MPNPGFPRLRERGSDTVSLPEKNSSSGKTVLRVFADQKRLQQKHCFRLARSA